MDAQKFSTESICDQISDLIPAYALGAADAEERTLVEANLARCPEAQAALAEYQALTENFLFSIPPATPPPHLAAKIEAALSAPAAPAPQSTARPGSAGWLAQLTSWLMPQGWNTSPVAALVLLAIVVFGGVYTIFQVNRLNTQQMALLERIDAQAALIAQQGEIIQDQTSVLVMLSAGNAYRAQLPAAEGVDPEVTAAALYDPEGNQAFIYARNFPALDVDQTYQIWLIQGETRVSGGTFNVDYYGRGIYVLWNREMIGNFDAIGITAEPAGGSDSPTSPPVVRGQLAAGVPVYGQ